MVQKLEQGGKLADEVAQAGLSVETASGFKRDATVPGLPAAAVAAAFSKRILQLACKIRTRKVRPTK